MSSSVEDYQKTGLVLGEIAAERIRQVEKEGWSKEHDDAHTDGSLADAAACYAANSPNVYTDESYVDHASRTKQRIVQLWPSSWDRTHLKRTDRRRDLIKSAALILAEIERLDRAAAHPSN